jgi:hypothetical protein
LRETITLYKRAVIALEENSQQSPPSAFVTVTLPAGHAVEVDCEDINGLISPGATTNFSVFTKGFVTILATGPLDVVGVYSGNPSTTADGITLEMLNIAPRIESGPPTSVAVPGRFYEYSAKFLCGPSNPT